MKALATPVLILLLGSFARADETVSRESFVKLRQRFAIDRTLRIDQLESFLTSKFTGARFIELRGMVTGSYSSPGMCGVLLEHPAADPIAIESDAVPDWLVGVEREARFILRVERVEITNPLRLVLIAAAPVEATPDVVPAAPKPAAKQVKPTTAKTPIGRGYKNLASRSGSRTWSLPVSEVTPIYASFIQARNPRLSGPEATRIAEGVVGFSVNYGVDARLIMSVIMVESGFDPFATSRKGAMGLGQLMPRTAAGLGVRRAYDSAENLYGMIKHLRRLLDKYYGQTGDSQRALQLSLAAYNAGEGNVHKYGGIPPFAQTQNYVRKIINIYAQLTDSR